MLSTVCPRLGGRTLAPCERLGDPARELRYRRKAEIQTDLLPVLRRSDFCRNLWPECKDVGHGTAPMFSKIRIAYRGEIACRIIKAANPLVLRCTQARMRYQPDLLHPLQRLPPPPPSICRPVCAIAC